MKVAFTIIRVSAEDQLRGYGPDAQWYEDVLPSAPKLGLEVKESLKVVIQEPATGWDREKFQEAVRDGMRLCKENKIQALLFPRVDRETRFLFGSFPLLAEVIRSGMEVYFAREKMKLDADDPETVERYLSKATQAQAYVETMRLNTMRGIRRRVLQDHKMSHSHGKWAFDYIPATGRYQKVETKAAWVARCYDWILDEGLSLNKCCERLVKEGVPSPGWERWQVAIQRGRKRKKLPRADRWHRGTLHNMLLDESVLGKFYAYRNQVVKGTGGRKRQIPTDPSKWILVYEDPSQAIVTIERYEAMKLKMARNKENSSRHAHHSYPPLRSMVHCTLCQRRMSGWTGNHGTTYYICWGCRNTIKAWSLWEELHEGIKVRIMEPGRLLPAVKSQVENGQSLSRLESEERSLTEQLSNWESARDKARRLYFIKPNYPEERYLADDRQMQDQQQRIAHELQEVKARITMLRQAMVDEEGIKRFCEEAAQNLDEMDDSRWRLLLEKLRLRVEVTPGEPITAYLALPALSGDGAIVSQSSASS